MDGYSSESHPVGLGWCKLLSDADVAGLGPHCEDHVFYFVLPFSPYDRYRLLITETIGKLLCLD